VREGYSYYIRFSKAIKLTVIITPIDPIILAITGLEFSEILFFLVFRTFSDIATTCQNII